MSEEKESVRIGIYLDKALALRCDAALPLTDARSRSAFISDALELYLTWLSGKGTTRLLTPALESVIGAKIADTENRLARVIFKQSVELAMLMHIVAATSDIPEESLSDLRKLCVDEVSKLSGRYRFEDALRFQKG